MWKAYDHKLEESRILNLQSWAVNLQSFQMVQSFKAKNRLQRLVPYKIAVLLFGILWVLFVGTLVTHIPFRINPYFSISAGLVLLINLVCMGGYIYHIVLIAQIPYDGDITGTQQKLARLQASTLAVIRLGWLQMPLYTTFFWHKSWVGFNSGFLLVALPVTLLFTGLAIYLYRNTTAANLHKKWMQLLVGKSPEYTAVLTAQGFIDEIERFKCNL